jgi:PAS domain S-box-containing protein
VAKQTVDKREKNGLTWSEQQFRELCENLGTGLVVVDWNGIYRFINNRAAEIMGALPGDIVGKSMFDFLPEETARSYLERNRRIMDSGVGEEYEDAFDLAAGKRSFLITDRPVKNDKGRVVALQSNSIDITDRKRAEESQKRSDDRFRAVFDHSLDAIMLSSPDDSVLAANGEMCRMLGMTGEEIIAAGRGGVVVQDDRLHAALKERTRTGIFRGELTFKRKGGTTFPVEVSSAVFRGVDGSSFTSTVMRDITEAKKAEAELLASRERLTEALDLARVVYWEADPDSGEFIFNDRFYAFYGTTAEREGGYRMSRKDYMERFVHPDDVELFDEQVHRRERDRRPEFHHSYEHRIVRRDGEIRAIVATRHVARDAEGQVQRFYGAHQDITERKSAEAAVRRGEASLAAAQRLTHIGSWEWNVLTDEAIWSDETFRIFGLQPGRLDAHRHSFLDFIHPQDKPRVDGALSDALSGTREYDLEYRIQLANGGTKIIHSLAETVRGADGKPVLMRGTVQDITDRRELEEERETSKRFLRLLNRTATKKNLIEAVVRFLREKSGCEAIGIRLKQDDDYPYYETHGFHEEFVLLESSLCARDVTGAPLTDKLGHPVMECMCGNVIQGRFDPSKPFFSPKGSFWTNSTTELLASSTEEDRQARTRNRCNGEGYESVALIPLRSGDFTIGLIQLNDREKGRFSPESITFWERLASYLAVALSKADAEEALCRSEERYRSIFDNAPDGVFQAHPKDGFITVNPAMVQMHGYSSANEMINSYRAGGTIFSNPDEKAEYLRRIDKNGRVDKYEANFRRKDGSTYWGLISARAVRDSQGRVDFYEGVIQDIDDRKTLQEQLFQAQKMEAIGTLAGGVAHDFNNILTVIMGLSNVVQMTVSPDDAIKPLIDQIVLSSERAAELTQSLLAFSRKQRMSFEPHGIDVIVGSTAKLLKRLLTEDIGLEVDLTAGDSVALIDIPQIDQVLMNLATNARDAMPNGGTLIIRTDVIRLDDSFRRTHGFGRAGAYVRLSVSDSGMGMDARTMTRIFDPFFTTKAVGKGTGLGLASVYGIVKQHGGYITVKSTLHQGTTFDIYLPLVEATMHQSTFTSTALQGGSETVLVVEDDRDVRNMITTILSKQGYVALEAANGDDAINILEKHKKQVALVILDVVMPGKNGRQVFDEIIGIEPEARVIFMSGYTGDIVIDKGIEKEKVDFLQKPVSVINLLAKVREVIDR